MALSANQGLILPDGTDGANVPLSFTDYNTNAENRLVQRYLSIADRTARNAAPNEGELSYLVDLNRYETYTGALWAPVLPSALFFGRQTVAQSIPNATVTALTFDVEDFDNVNGHSTSVNTSRYTVQVAGWYRVQGGVAFAVNATGVRTVQIAKNGADYVSSGTSAPASGAVSIRLVTKEILVSAVVGDYFEITAFQSSGAPLNTAVTGVEQANLLVEWRAFP